MVLGAHGRIHPLTIPARICHKFTHNSQEKKGPKFRGKLPQNFRLGGRGAPTTPPNQPWRAPTGPHGPRQETHTLVNFLKPPSFDSPIPGSLFLGFFFLRRQFWEKTTWINSQDIFKDMFFFGGKSWRSELHDKCYWTKVVKLVREVGTKDAPWKSFGLARLTNETMVFSGRNLRSDCCDSIYKMKSNDSTKKLNHLRPKKLVLKCREGERVYRALIIWRPSKKASWESLTNQDFTEYHWWALSTHPGDLNGNLSTFDP